jgi:flagella synthesis protein FlgN
MDDHSQGLIAVLHEQIRCAEAMLRTLGRENQALVDGNAEELNAAGAEKARLVETLESLEGERRGLTQVITAGLLGDTPTRANAQTVPEWQRLLDLIAECKQRNEHNGALVKARSEQVRVALRALRGGTEPDFYGRSGRTAAPTDARPLGTA